MSDTDIVRHDVDLGWNRLYIAPKDIRDPENNVLQAPEFIECSSSLASLHKLYVDDVEWASQQAVEWWADIVEAINQSGHDITTAALEAYETWPCGPASSEYIISVCRRYWLACVGECEQLPEQMRMLPEDFLLMTLSRVKHRRAVLVLTGLPYWPIGLDEDGNWC